MKIRHLQLTKVGNRKPPSIRKEQRRLTLLWFHSVPHRLLVSSVYLAKVEEMLLTKAGCKTRSRYIIQDPPFHKPYYFPRPPARSRNTIRRPRSSSILQPNRSCKLL